MKRSTAYRISLVAMCAVLLFVAIVPASAASSSFTVDFSGTRLGTDAQFYIVQDDSLVDVTSTISKSSLTQNVSGLGNWHFTEFAYPVSYSTYSKYFMISLAGLQFYSDSDYTFETAVFQNFNSQCHVTLSMVYLSLDGQTTYEHITFYDSDVSLSFNPLVLQGTLHTPSISGSYNIYLVYQVNLLGSELPINVMQRYRLGDFRFSLDSPLYGDHYENDTSEIDDLNNRIESVEGQLPSMEDVPLDELFGDVSIEDYNNGFVAVNNMFDTVIGVTDFGAVILFCLAIGLCTYLLGRRVRG